MQERTGVSLIDIVCGMMATEVGHWLVGIVQWGGRLL